MKRGLVLSGGAAWGLANIGIMEVLEREGISFHCIAGSSMGAIIAGLYALGIPVQKYSDLAEKISLLKVAKLSTFPLPQGLHSGLLRQQLHDILFPLIGDATIGDCRIPFVCIAGKVKKPVEWLRILSPDFTKHFLDSVEPIIFPPETRMLDALLASSAIPVVFSPVTIGNDTFVDLVHFGAIPARALRAAHHPDVIIASDTQPRYGLLRRFLPQPWAEFIQRGQAEVEADRTACDLIIEPKMPAAVFRFDRAKDFIRAGRIATEKLLPEVRNLCGRD